MNMPMVEAARIVADVLKSRKQTVAVAESSSGGLISAALLAAPGASAYFLGGAVVDQSYADEIGADAYAADAMESVRIAQRFTM